VAPTQDVLYAGLDLELSWSERQLPERERTKHVHRLHPYVGKFIPQLVEVLLRRYFRPGRHVLDPFAGSGTTAVQALESGLDATAVELAAFNCLLISVKTARYEPFRLERELRDACARLERFEGADADVAGDYLRSWYAPAALAELLFWRSLVGDYEHADVLRVVLSRAARSARRAPHFDLEAPRAPQLDEYWCHKHKRVCRPVASARQFLRRYAEDTVARIREYGRVRARARTAAVVRGDARFVRYGRGFDGILTSPPYPGLLDYHEQHRYAYELLGLEDRREAELGAAAAGTTRAALAAYADGMVASLRTAAGALEPGAPVVIVVNDRRELYPEILERVGLRLEERLRRHVNRRTGRRAGEFFEDVLVARVD
jgi:DNA methylase